ncbi:MAG: sigH, partial [Acidimicrobiales bacterium]|nr:sigH [Acidimicrobiales bacterium]
MARTLRLSDSATDLELVAAAQAGDPVAFDRLVDRYRRFVRSRSRGYFIVGGDREDLEQEALIGFYKSVRDFKPELQASFRAFAELCINRQLITAIKTATRKKHQPLNQSVSFSAPRPGDDRDDRDDEIPAAAD